LALIHPYFERNSNHDPVIDCTRFKDRGYCDRQKGKREVVPVLLTKHHAMKAYWGRGSIDQPIFWPRQ